MRVRIQAIDRLTNSYNGNPRFAIAYGPIIDGTVSVTHVANTAADAAFGYEIGNPGLRVGDVVELTIGGRGTITSMRSAS